MDDDDFDYELEGGDESEDEFVEFVTKLSEQNRARQIRENIERRLESRRMGDLLGIEGFELSPNY